VLAGCGPLQDRPVPAVDPSCSAEEIRAILNEIADRSDVAASLERARAYDRLRQLGQGPEADLLSRGDAADLAVLAQPAAVEVKRESATRLSRHFRERAAKPGLARSTFQGPLGPELRRFVFDTCAAYFGEVASREEHAQALETMAGVAAELADHAALKPEARDRWHQRARLYALRAVDRAALRDAPPEPGPDAVKFCEFDGSRRLEEATRCADYGTREKAARGDPERALEWYILSLCHFAVVREVVATPTPAQAHALAAQDIVVRCLSELLCRE
jgi:hypothetical protein